MVEEDAPIVASDDDANEEEGSPVTKQPNNKKGGIPTSKTPKKAKKN